MGWEKFKKELKEDWQEIKGMFRKESKGKREIEVKGIIDSSYENKRNFVRMNTYYKLKSKLVIIGIGDLNIRSEPKEVVIKDISANGVSFLTNDYIDLSNKIKAEISFKLLNEDIESYGELVRLVNYGSPFKYLYGVKIEGGNKTEDEMYKLLVKTGIDFNKVTSSNSSVWEEYRSR